jgi:signal transduction histidine kinase
MEDKHRNKSSVLRTALLSSLAASWLLLAGFQYKWATELRNSTEARLRSTLEVSLADWQRDLYDELSVPGSLDSGTLQNQVFPKLTRRHFQTHDARDYRLAIVAIGTTPTIVYSSDSTLTLQDVQHFDAKLSLFNAGLGSSQNRQWVLFATYRAGPVAAIANALWYRQLILGAAPLLVLATCIVLLMTLNRREQKLARLQMEFVASVSHELRTPLSAIFSAGENIRDGYVEGQKDLKFYGSILTSQSRRLIDLVDRVLLLASNHSGEKKYSIARIPVPDVLAAVHRNIGDELADQGCTLEQDIDPSLPDVWGDLSGICVCLQNLIGNATKYGGSDRWICLSAVCEQTDAGAEVAFRIQDHGRGIRPSEFQRIFDPFYRSPDVLAAKIPGTGLGLALSQKIAKSLGGRISVMSQVGVGSTFTLHLRAAPPQKVVDQPISADSEILKNE